MSTIDTEITRAESEFRPITVPERYEPALGTLETEQAIREIKTEFQRRLSASLNLRRVSAPLFVPAESGINDHLNGVEQPVGFVARETGRRLEVVQSLAKWKRHALAEYGFEPYEGLYTDMNAVRPDETTGNLHSLYVDQWDWEKVILRHDRTVDYLKETVNRIYTALKVMERSVCERYPVLGEPALPHAITFIHAEELLERYPDSPPKMREHLAAREHGAVFLIGIGGDLADGSPHDGRAADYDDWTTPTGDGFRGLNGDIVCWFDTLQCAFELSSMGIRVDADSLVRQLGIRGETYKTDLPWHRKLLAGELPLSIGGGIGQSRLCMFLLKKAHIGEVQVGTWPDEMVEDCAKRGIRLL